MTIVPCARFSLNNLHKGGIKLDYFICNIDTILDSPTCKLNIHKTEAFGLYVCTYYIR